MIPPPFSFGDGAECGSGSRWGRRAYFFGGRIGVRVVKRGKARGAGAIGSRHRRRLWCIHAPLQQRRRRGSDYVVHASMQPGMLHALPSLASPLASSALSLLFLTLSLRLWQTGTDVPNECSKALPYPWYERRIWVTLGHRGPSQRKSESDGLHELAK
jgi:hypothetical protein